MKSMFRIVFISVALVLTWASQNCLAAKDAKSPDSVSGDANKSPALFYHIFVRSFSDSNGDQHGDLLGILQRLDYLESLGVTGILLTPLYPSEFYHNYFADDFYGVDEEFGSLEDYQQLLHEAHARGIEVILDQEIQYVSGNHQWSISATTDPGSDLAKYVLTSGANGDPMGTLFGRTQFNVWPRQSQNIYTVDMGNPDVLNYFIAYLRFWMDPNADGDFSDGADGFRIDHMMDDLDNAGILTDLFASFWTPMFDELRKTNPQIKIIAEQADWGYGKAFVNEGSADMVFGFPIREAVVDFDSDAFVSAISRTNDVLGQNATQFLFLENHDTNRFASEVGGDQRRLRFGAAVNLLTGWVPIIYYGQEIGMRGRELEGSLDATLKLSEHDIRDVPVREAMRWQSNLASAEMATWYLIDRDAYNLASPNDAHNDIWVDVQDADPESLLNFYRRLSALRRSIPALAHGAPRVMLHERDVVVLQRGIENSEALIFLNFADSSTTVDIDHPTMRSGSLVEVHGEVQSVGAALSLSPYAVAVVVNDSALTNKNAH